MQMREIMNLVERTVDHIEEGVDIGTVGAALREAVESPAQQLITRVAQMQLPAKIRVLRLDDHRVELTDFEATEPGKGAGRATMQAILALADALHVTLEAWPMYDEDVEGGLDQDDLVAWYQRLGFRYLPKRDPDSDRYMVRKPRPFKR